MVVRGVMLMVGVGVGVGGWGGVGWWLCLRVGVWEVVRRWDEI